MFTEKACNSKMYKIVKFTCFTFVFVCLFFTSCGNNDKHDYRVSGAGEGAIMFDAKTGDSWVLEKQDATCMPRKDFVSPNGNYYFWAPTAVKPCYEESVGAGRNPEEAKTLDEYGFQAFKQKFSH